VLVLASIVHELKYAPMGHPPVRMLAGPLDPRQRHGRDVDCRLTRRARRDTVRRPFADMPFTTRHVSCGGGNRLAFGQQEHGPRPLGQGPRRLRCPQPAV
jgi:hypothetical protein